MEERDTTANWTIAYMEWMDMQEWEPAGAGERMEGWLDPRKQDLFCEAMMLLSSLRGCDRRHLHGEAGAFSPADWEDVVEGIAVNMHALAARMLALQSGVHGA